jgi:hypothetical protein
MADSKLSALTELAAAPSTSDELYIRDVSELASAESKRITVANLFTTPTIAATGWTNANHAHAASNSGGQVAAGYLSGTTLKSTVVTSSLTTVGVLNSGSITSGFGSIDIGSSTLSATGTITGPSGTWDSGGMDIASGDSYAIAGTDVLVAATLGSGVTASSLTSLGTLTALVMGNDATIRRDVNSGLTASTTQTQGNGALTADINEVSTVATDDDTVTLRTAVAGETQTIINNGSKRLRIFPASSDNLGAGANTALAGGLLTGENITFLAYDATNWEEV